MPRMPKPAPLSRQEPQRPEPVGLKEVPRGMPFRDLPAGTVFQFEAALALGYEDVRVKLEDGSVRNLHPTLERDTYVPDRDWRVLALPEAEQAEWLTFLAESLPTS